MGLDLIEGIQNILRHSDSEIACWMLDEDETCEEFRDFLKEALEFLENCEHIYCWY